MIVKPVGDGKTGPADKPHDKVDRTQGTAEFIENIIYLDSLVSQKPETVITMKVILGIQTINSHRIIILFHFPHNGCNMIDVVELSDKKKVHIHTYGFKVLGSKVQGFRVLNENPGSFIPSLSLTLNVEAPGPDLTLRCSII
jgi:hypothetical protein